MENLKQLKIEIIKQILRLDNAGSYAKEEQKYFISLLKRCNINIKPRFSIEYLVGNKLNKSIYYSKKAFNRDVASISEWATITRKGRVDD